MVLGLASISALIGCTPYPYGPYPAYGAPPPAPAAAPAPPPPGAPPPPPQATGPAPATQGWAPPGAPQSPSPSQTAWLPPAQAPAANPTAPAPLAGDCSGSCTHYLRCKAILNQQNLSACVQQCTGSSPDPQTMSWYVTTDCPTAITFLENLVKASQAAVAPKPASGSGSSECNGCVWDGSACIWLSQSNWGAGPYSGAAGSCNPACCGR
jgi:hypothetical protein